MKQPSISSGDHSRGLRRSIAVVAAVLLVCCGDAPRASLAQPLDPQILTGEYRAWLDHGRTPAQVVAYVRKHAAGWSVADPLATAIPKVSPGDRLIFVAHDRSVLMVVVGETPLGKGGARLIGAHIDTPSPRVDTANLTRSGQATLSTSRYGGMRMHHWKHRPLAMVGRVVKAGGAVVDIALGFEQDDFAFFISQAQERTLMVTTGSMPAGDKDKAGTAMTIVDELHRRYGLTAADLNTAEIYLVPRERAREVGVDRSLIGAHGQDDRANSYAAWRAIMDIERTRPPRVTVMTWLVDREEEGSYHVAGAHSRFLETVYAYLLRAQGSPATEVTMARAFAASVAISADTPAAVNPNWPEVHEPLHGPIMGKGAVLFPFTGRGGKEGGSAANAQLVRSVMAAFERAGAMIQVGELGRVDEGGGGTIAKYLARRGIDVIDVGVPLISMHSPFELCNKDDLWSAYRGFAAWFMN